MSSLSMIGLISLASIRSSNGEVKAALEKVKGLLYDYASVHRALEMPVHSAMVDASVYLRALCQSIRRSRLDARNIRLAFVAPPLQLRSDRCWRLGMIVSELIANSVKHAFSSQGGSIQVELASSGSLIRCRVSDNGSSEGQSLPGSGLKIIEALARESTAKSSIASAPAALLRFSRFPRIMGFIAQDTQPNHQPCRIHSDFTP
jgi:two-component sensor histidine kinase